MKELIKQILREYTGPKVLVKVVGTYNGNINEYLLKEQVNNNQVIQSKNRINNILSQINPFKSCYVDTRTNNERCGLLKIELTNHWVERLFRLDDVNYAEGGRYHSNRIQNPELLEGIDLILNNKKKIIKTILSLPSNRRNNLVLEIKNQDSKNVYNMIVSVEEGKPKEPIKLVLITQIKGVNFLNYHNKKPNTIIKVHTLGDKT